MVDCTTGTAICTRLAAQDRHGPKAPVPLALCTFCPRRSASAMHAHLTAPAAQSTIYGASVSCAAYGPRPVRQAAPQRAPRSIASGSAIPVPSPNVRPAANASPQP